MSLRASEFSSLIFHLAWPLKAKGETGSRRFPPLRQKAYFFFAAFFFPAFFLAFFLAAMVQSPVKEWIALAIPRWIAGSQNRYLAALTTRPPRGS